MVAWRVKSGNYIVYFVYFFPTTICFRFKSTDGRKTAMQARNIRFSDARDAKKNLFALFSSKKRDGNCVVR